MSIAVEFQPMKLFRFSYCGDAMPIRKMATRRVLRTASQVLNNEDFDSTFDGSNDSTDTELLPCSDSSGVKETPNKQLRDPLPLYASTPQVKANVDAYDLSPEIEREDQHATASTISTVVEREIFVDNNLRYASMPQVKANADVPDLCPEFEEEHVRASSTIHTVIERNIHDDNNLRYASTSQANADAPDYLSPVLERNISDDNALRYASTPQAIADAPEHSPEEQHARASSTISPIVEREISHDNDLRPTNQSQEMSLLLEGSVADQLTNDPQKCGSRKRKRNPTMWKCNKVSRACAQGEEYVNKRGKTVAAKKVKEPCTDTCRLKCSMIVSEEERQRIFSDFYSLPTEQKWSFIVATTKRFDKARTRTKEEKGDSRRTFSFKYFFNIEEQLQYVCKTMYLHTLDISQKMVYGVHDRKDSFTGSIGKDKRGSNPTSSRQMSTEKVDAVKKHILSFPAVSSHYCRQKSSKIYLESWLTVPKMYQLYTEECRNLQREPVKESYYRSVFNSSFNLGFHKPKTDRCDICELKIAKSKEGELSAEDSQLFSRHDQEKTAARTQKSFDKTHLKDKLDHIIVCFDLQNVITCPKSDISSFFYSRKLSVYNLTAHDSRDKRGYCAVWCESTSGRAGNDLASAFIKIMERVISSYGDVKNITTWSDSCVPQNRNSIISFAVQELMSRHPHLETFTMKYSVPGHGLVQEVDNIHSNLESAFQVAEYFSPVSLLRVMLRARPSKPHVVLQMRPDDFKDFQVRTSAMQYSAIPYSKIAAIKFKRDSSLVSYITSFSDQEWTEVDVKPTAQTRRKLNLPRAATFLQPPIIKKNVRLPVEKVKDLKKLLKFMPLQDRQFYETLFLD